MITPAAVETAGMPPHDGTNYHNIYSLCELNHFLKVHHRKPKPRWNVGPKPRRNANQTLLVWLFSFVIFTFISFLCGVTYAGWLVGWLMRKKWRENIRIHPFSSAIFFFFERPKDIDKTWLWRVNSVRFRLTAGPPHSRCLVYNTESAIRPLSSSCTCHKKGISK